MGVRIFHRGSTVSALIEGDIDHHTAKNIRETLDSEVENTKPALMELDFSGVNFMDSSGIGLIMGRFKVMSSVRGKLKVINIPKRLERMIKLSGLMALGIFEKGENSNAKRS